VRAFYVSASIKRYPRVI